MSIVWQDTTLTNLAHGTTDLAGVAERDPFQGVVPVHTVGHKLPKQVRPRGVEADGLKYYQEQDKAGDYLSIDPDSLDYYIKNVGKAEYEARATAIKGEVTSVCTCSVSVNFLRTKCHRVPKSDIPLQWLERL